MAGRLLSRLARLSKTDQLAHLSQGNPHRPDASLSPKAREGLAGERRVRTVEGVSERHQRISRAAAVALVSASAADGIDA